MTLESYSLPIFIYDAEISSIITSNSAYRNFNVPLEIILNEFPSLQENKAVHHDQMINNFIWQGFQYHVRITPIEKFERHYVVSFHPYTSNPRLFPEHLSIITSSIAHELNNPLAGIMAATQVIQMGIQDGPGMQPKHASLFQEMHEALSRAQFLVETFLRFSIRQENQKSKVSTSKVLEEVTSLTRTRMVQLDTHISFKLLYSDNDEMECYNANVFTMILYLVVTDIISAYSLSDLILQNHVEKNVALLITVNSAENTLSLEICDPQVIRYLTRPNKLLEALLQIEYRKLEFINSVLTLSNLQMH